MDFFKTFIFLFLLYWMFISTSSMVGVRSIFEILCVVLLFTGAVIGLLAFFMMSGIASYMSVVASYSMLIVGISLFFGFALHNVYNSRKMDGSLNSKMNWFGKIIVDVLPFLLMAMNLGYLLYLITANKSIVTSPNINNDYIIFSKIFIILTIIQTSMIYYGINSSKTGAVEPLYNALLILMCVVCFYIIRIIKIVIVDYPVDCITCQTPSPAQPSTTSTSSSSPSTSLSTSLSKSIASTSNTLSTASNSLSTSSSS